MQAVYSYPLKLMDLIRFHWDLLLKTASSHNYKKWFKFHLMKLKKCLYIAQLDLLFIIQVDEKEGFKHSVLWGR